MQTPTQIGQKQRIRALTYGDFIDFKLIEKIKIKDFQDLAKEFLANLLDFIKNFLFRNFI